MKKGFTLAEVLITLVIIGVIAAITIPSLIAKYQKEQFVSQYKKAFNTVAQAIQMSQAVNGQLDSWDYENISTLPEFSEKYLVPYFRIIKNCKTELNRDCFANVTYKYLNGNNWFNPNKTERYRFVLNDGMSVYIASYSQTGCITTPTNCFSLWVDINGKKGPNQAGRDFFGFSAFPFVNKIVPDGTMKYPSIYHPETKTYERQTKEEILENSCGATKNGAGCGALIILDGYQMNY